MSHGIAYSRFMQGDCFCYRCKKVLPLAAFDSHELRLYRPRCRSCRVIEPVPANLAWAYKMPAPTLSAKAGRYGASAGKPLVLGIEVAIVLTLIFIKAGWFITKIGEAWGWLR